MAQMKTRKRSLDSSEPLISTGHPRRQHSSFRRCHHQGPPSAQIDSHLWSKILRQMIKICSHVRQSRKIKWELCPKPQNTKFAQMAAQSELRKDTQVTKVSISSFVHQWRPIARASNSSHLSSSERSRHLALPAKNPLVTSNLTGWPTSTNFRTNRQPEKCKNVMKMTIFTAKAQIIPTKSASIRMCPPQNSCSELMANSDPMKSLTASGLQMGKTKMKCKIVQNRMKICKIISNWK